MQVCLVCLNWCIRTLIHPLSAEYSSILEDEAQKCKKMHPFEVLDVTGLGDTFLAIFPKESLLEPSECCRQTKINHKGLSKTSWFWQISPQMNLPCYKII